MGQQATTRETRIGLFTFAGLAIAVSCNLFLMQGRRVNNSVETSAILKPAVSSQEGRSADSEAQAAGGVAAGANPQAERGSSQLLAPPQPASRPLPVAIAPPASVSRSDMVRAIQKGLSSQGYEPGTPDGLTGLMTRAAIMAYEADSGMALTAEPSEDLMRRIEMGAKAVPVARKGAPEVKTVEAASLIRSVGTWLGALGYPVAKNETSMSTALVRAIRDYEASQKMPETGRISAALVARLSRAGQTRAAAR